MPTPWIDKSREDAKWEVDLNIWGVYNCTKLVGQEMLDRESGSVINITSNSGLLGEAADQVAHYGGTKGYVASLSKGLAFEWGPRKVRVNCIAPGWILPAGAVLAIATAGLVPLALQSGDDAQKQMAEDAKDSWGKSNQDTLNKRR